MLPSRRAERRTMLQAVHRGDRGTPGVLPQGHDGRRVTARANGQGERPFRSVKERHETLYHFHTPATEAEANAWLCQVLRRDNAMPPRTATHRRLDDWVRQLPPAGRRAMGSWERLCTVAREPERRKGGVEARGTVEGVAYAVAPDLAGDTGLRFPWRAGLAAPAVIPLAAPDPCQEVTLPTVLAAKRAVAEARARPLATLTAAALEALHGRLARTLRKPEVLASVRTHVTPV